MEWIELINDVFKKEIYAATLTQKSLGQSVCEICEAIDGCLGHVILTGMGKSGHISKKISATMSSIGIKSFFMHPGEAAHGDLGMIDRNDIIIAVSNSGETAELLGILPRIKKWGIPVYSIIGRAGSKLESYSKASIILPTFPEAFLDKTVPTSSTTVELMIGDALAVAVATKRGFTEQDFGEYHPHGQLGKRLTLRVEELMLTGEENPVITQSASVSDAVFEMCKKGIGGVNIVSNDGILIGVFTDGDLRRMHSRFGSTMDTQPIMNVMTRTPITLEESQLVATVVEEMKSLDRKVSFYPVVNKGKLTGSLRVLDISKSGLL